MKTLKKLLNYTGLILNKRRKPIYHFKGNFLSTHSKTINYIRSNTKVLDIGCYNFAVANFLKKKNCFVDGIDNINLKTKNKINKFFKHNLNNGLPKNINYLKYDYIIMLDVIEHLDNPEHFIKQLKNLVKKNKKVKILVSTPNIAFIIMRISLFFGNFNYADKGILDFTHKRLFTFKSFLNLFLENNFKIVKKIGIPAPFPAVLGYTKISFFFLNLNALLIKLQKKLFSFQMLFIIKP